MILQETHTYPYSLQVWLRMLRYLPLPFASVDHTEHDVDMIITEESIAI